MSFRIPPPSQVYATTPDALTKSLVDRNDINNEDARQNIKLKRTIAWWTMIIVSLWLVSVVAFLYWGNFFTEKPPSNAVIIALLVSSSANVLGLPLIIIRGLFLKS
jgi:hypothetical protein